MIAAIAAIATLGLIVYNAAVKTAGEDHLRLVAQAQIASCRAGNTVRAVGVIEAGRNAREPRERQQALLRVYIFRDCEQTSEQGREVSLPRSERDQLIDRIARLMGVGEWRADRARP